jgi:serine/threonine-protein kinase HipA
MMDFLLASINSKEDRKNLLKVIVFYDLLHNTDSHAKNFSIILSKHGFKLTPMYDVLSAHFLLGQDKEYHSNLRGVISINNKFIYNQITKDDWYIEAKNCGINKDTVDEIFSELKKSLTELTYDKSELPVDLDLEQLDLIISGVRQRTKIYI